MPPMLAGAPEGVTVAGTDRRKESGGLSGVEHDDAVVVAREDRTGGERDAAELDGNIDLPHTLLDAAPRHGAERLDPDRHVPEHCGVANPGVEDEPDPAVRGGDACDQVADERRAERAASVDHEHPAVAGAFDLLPQEHVVVEAADSRDRP